MDIEQKTDLTFMKVDEMNNKVDEILLEVSALSSAENLGSSSDGVSAKVDSVSAKMDTLSETAGAISTKTDAILENTKNTSTKINDVSAGVDSVNTKVDGVSAKIESAKGEIVGADNVDLTQISNKLNTIATFLSDNPLPEEFKPDPFKLDEEFLGYTKKAQIFNTTDSIECTKEYTINELGNNTYFYILQVGVYSEDETFSIKFTCDIETINSNAQIEYNFVDATIGTTTNKKVTENLTLGRNIFSKTIENINVLENGNYVFVRLPNGNGTIMHSYKLEVFGSNVAILTKPKKFKVFSKFDEVVISKIENNCGYFLCCPNSELGANVVNKKFTLDQENVRDYYKSYCALRNGTITAKGVLMKTFVEIDGYFYLQISNAPKFKVYNYRGEIVDSIDYTSNNNLAITGQISSYSSFSFSRSSCYLDNTNSSLILGAANQVIADFTFVKHLYKVDTVNDNRAFSMIMTKRNGDNILFDEYASNGLQINLGYGKNVTAYFDKDDDNKIYVYMKVGDKMVKKTVQKVTTTNEDETTTTTFEIIEQKVIGTYDIYYETNTDKYFVVKDNELYIYKN